LGGLGDLAAGQQQPRPPDRHRVVQRDHLRAQLDPLGLADRLQRAGRITLGLPDPGQHAKAGGQRLGVGQLLAQRDPLGHVLMGGE
jgi:hypothetical protein